MKKKIGLIVIISMLITFLMPSATLASGSVSLTDKLVPTDGEAYDYFGYSVAVSGDIAVIGSYYDDSYSGSVYIYNLYTGSVQKITASDGATGDIFGVSVAILGDKVVVGSMGDDDNGSSSGSIYIYDLSDNYSETKITAFDGAADDKFGYAVAISENYVAVGAYGDNYSQGAVYVYNLSDGSLKHKISAFDGESGDLFGASVSISGNLMVAGAFHDNDNGMWSGSAYVYDVSDGSMVTKLTASDGVSQDIFGNAVAISGDIVVVGAKDRSEGEYYTGAAYVYDLSDGGAETKLVPSDIGSMDTFGASVAVSGNKILVGSPGDDDIAASAGAAYLYDFSDLSDVTKITANDGASNDNLGISVAISESNMVIGAYADDAKGINSGSAYYIYAPESNVTLNNLGGIGETSVVAVYGEAMPIGVAAPTREGYSFVGYYRNLYEASTKYYDFDMSSVQNWDIIGDTTLYAKWEPVPITISTAALSEATVGEDYTFTVEAVGGVGTRTWYATGLPQGLSIAADTGIISGKTNESGDFAVNITVYDGEGKIAVKDFTLTVNAQPQTGKYTITPAVESIYTISTSGFTTLTINSGVSGFKCIEVNITPVVAHEGEETVVFVHLRGGVQIGFNCTVADFDIINTAIAGFNVAGGDEIKIYVVDRISNDPSVNPVLLQ